jgi:molybdate transport system ATP-binding protein
MSLDVDIQAKLGGFDLDAQVKTSGRVTALFGRSGAGKTSLAQAIAGLVRPKAGYIRVGGQTLFDAAQGINRPAWQRQIGYVFQDARLFPHMSVLQNLTYGAGSRPNNLGQTIGLLGLEALLGRSPHTLSGGEARRVAIGRALLRQPSLLVLDEPLSGLDGARRSSVLDCLEQIKISGGPQILYISHALDEIVRLSDDVVLMSGGKTLATQPLERVFDYPEAATAAGLTCPISVLTGVVIAYENGMTQLALGLERQALFTLPRPDASHGQRVRFVVEASDVAIALSDPTDSSVQNRLAVMIDQVVPFGPGTDLVTLSGRGFALRALITHDAALRLSLARGMQVTALIKAVSRTSIG